jgi:putative ABC transport system permease protein
MQIFTMAVLIACGVAVLVASWSSYLSLERAKNIYYEKYRFADVFADFVRSPLSVLHEIQKLPLTEIAEGRILQDALLDLPGQAEPALGRVISWSSDQLLNKIYIRQGRFPERGRNLEALVHESFAKAHHMQAGDHFFMTIKGLKSVVTVSGIGISPEYVYALSPLSSFPDDLHFGVLWMPHEDLERLSNMQGAINNLVIKVARHASVETLKNQMNTLISKYGGLGAYDRSQQLSHLFVQDEIRQQKSMSTIVPGIFILVAAFILHTVLSRLIGLQRPQIATLKSIGYTSGSLVLYYWKLVTVILLVGIIPANIFAWGIGQWYAYLYERYFRFPSIDFSLSAEAVSVGILGGVLPSWLASSTALLQVFSLNPAEAMRPPTPINTYFIRKRIFKGMRVQVKMILRNILAKPWRSFFSIAGISAATAILINGSFWSDIMDNMIDQQFRKLHREDLEVQFLHPRKQEALSLLEKMDGVYLVQGSRTAALKLKFKNFSKDTILTSIPTAERASASEQKDTLQEDNNAKSNLRRVLDNSGKNIKVPLGQVLLGQFFSKKFHIKAGDEISLEVLDKTSPPFSVRVAGFIDEIVGSAIYANKSDLHKWLRENPSFTSASIKIAADKSTQLYLKLKEMPEITSISIKKLAYESFTETISEMIVTFTLILIGFASAISGAVLFNMARISLSERSWELASLKIMGYDLFEVFEVLHTEMGIEIILALIPGLLIGYGLSYLSTKWIHTDIFSFPLVIETTTYAMAVTVIVTIYFLTGFYLFRKIKHLDLTAALKARE